MSTEIPMRRVRWGRYLLLSGAMAFFMAPYGFLVILSLGSGWSFPAILPDRIDFAPWRNFWANRDGLFAAAGSSMLMSLLVGPVSTVAGLIVGRSLRMSTGGRWLFVAYLPFVISPVVLGTCLHDLTIRLGWASTMMGVVLTQGIFAFAFATVFFCEMWSADTIRAEAAVSTLGGNTWHVWRHAIIPRVWRLILVCLLQTLLFSWLDYGLVSVIGGGAVPSLTLMLFSYIREASVNQAAQSGIILLIPPMVVILLTVLVWSRSWLRAPERMVADARN